MYRFPIVKFAAIALLLLLASPAYACNILYGDDWAFISTEVDGWYTACGEEALQGTVVTLVPISEKDQPSNVIYVTVSSKYLPDLEAFVSDSQNLFKETSPDTIFTRVTEKSELTRFEYKLFHVQVVPSNRNELIAYVDGPTAYYTLVLTTTSEEVLQKYQEAYFSYISNFIPTKKN